MRLTFWGAARQVTGSMCLLELAAGYRVLIDCGMDMARRKEKIPPEAPLFPFPASSIDLVILTHAHLDHSGRLPNLFQADFEGQVLCTLPTLDLAALLLQDAARLNRRKLQSYLKKRKKQPASILKKSSPKHLYLENEVQKTIDRFVTIGFHQKFTINAQLSVTLLPTGHLLGASNVLLEIKEGGVTKKMLFSGDVGRANYPLLPDPVLPPPVDYLICETTYGNRLHTHTKQAADELLDTINKSCVDIPGRLIIPAFSIGRTQVLLYILHRLYTEKKLPPVKIFADSPMGFKSNQIYEKYHTLLNPEAQAFKNTFGSLFNFDLLHYVADSKQSRQISSHAEACIIISSSGMIEGGRIQHHVAKNLQNPYATIMMVGYSAEGTLGRKLLSGEKNIQIGKRQVNIAARISRTDAFSGHADRADLLRFVHAQNPESLQKLFLVHGETEAMNAFSETTTADGYRVEIPEKGQTYTL